MIDINNQSESITIAMQHAARYYTLAAFCGNLPQECADFSNQGAAFEMLAVWLTGEDIADYCPPGVYYER